MNFRRGTGKCHSQDQSLLGPAVALELCHYDDKSRLKFKFIKLVLFINFRGVPSGFEPQCTTVIIPPVSFGMPASGAPSLRIVTCELIELGESAHTA